MAIVEVSYRRVFNLGNFESLAVELKGTVEELQDHEAVYVGLVDEAMRLADAYRARGAALSVSPAVASSGPAFDDRATEKQQRLIQHMREDVGKEEQWLRDLAWGLRIDLDKLSKRDASVLIDHLKTKGASLTPRRAVGVPAEEELPF